MWGGPITRPRRTSPSLNIPHQRGILVAIELTLIHGINPKSLVYFGVHFLFTCYGFDTCWYFIIVSYKTVSALKIQFHPVTPTCHNHWCFLCLHSFHLKFFHVFLWLDSSFLFSTHPLLFLTVLLRWSRPTVKCTFLLGFFGCWLVGWLVFLGPHPQHMKVPRLGVESEL